MTETIMLGSLWPCVIWWWGLFSWDYKFDDEVCFPGIINLMMRSVFLGL